MAFDDKYTYPNSGGVLRNRLDIRDPVTLDRALNDHVSVAWAALRREPPPAAPGFDHLQTIHRRLFGALLPWAGTIRDVDVQAVGTGIAYCRPDFIEEQVQVLFGKLAAENYLADAPSPDHFALALAARWADLSAIHPFRDGNTRSQVVYVTSLALRAGLAIEWRSMDVTQLKALRIKAIAGTHEP